MSGADVAASWILELRTRLASPAPTRLPPSEARRAAVLVPIYVDAGQLWTVLTRRSDELPHHKGQIAFPGGSLELGESAWQAALRESEEELAIDPRRVIRLGELDEAGTPSGFRIVPCVGAVPYPLETRLNDGEITEVFAVPLLAFTDVRVVEERDIVINGQPRSVRIYHVAGRPVWGLTARIVQNLLARIGYPAAPLDTGVE